MTGSTIRDRILARAGLATERPSGALILSPPLREALADRGAGILFGHRAEAGGWTVLRAESLDVRPLFGGEPIAAWGTAATEGVPPDCPRLAFDPAAPDHVRVGGALLHLVSDDPERYHDRVRALPGVDALRGRTALVVGLGSVGADLGGRLVRLGARVIGVDPDVLVMENLVRWGLVAEPARDLGRPKAVVFAERLRAAVPGARVEGHVLDVVKDAGGFEALLAGRIDLLVVTTDTRDSRRAANAAAVRHGIPGLYVALSDGAASARVEVVEDARRGPCHLCAALHEGAAGEAAFEGRRTLEPYASAPAPGVRAVPALPVDVALGTAVATRVAIQVLGGLDWRPFLARGEQRGNVLFFSLRPDHWLFDEPWDRVVYAVEHHPDCPVEHAPGTKEVMP